MALAEHGRATGEADPDQWHAAAEAWRQAGEPWRLAYALFRLAEAHVERRDRQAAAKPLAEALVIANRLRAMPLVDDIQALVIRSRVSAEPALQDETDNQEPIPFGLTKRELQVLHLVTEGKSNAEIATELYMSTKTASVHVSRILAKLGVAKRGEAAALANRFRLFAE
jgi:DNA-binding NarL/FixJ family response regulator